MPLAGVVSVSTSAAVPVPVTLGRVGGVVGFVAELLFGVQPVMAEPPNPTTCAATGPAMPSTTNVAAARVAATRDDQVGRGAWGRAVMEQCLSGSTSRTGKRVGEYTASAS